MAKSVSTPDRGYSTEHAPSALEDLSGELQSLHKTLVAQFKSGQWAPMASTLERLAKVGEHEGQRELCLRAQSLRDIMGERAGGREKAGKRLQELFSELLFHLSHLQWRNQTSH